MLCDPKLHFSINHWFQERPSNVKREDKFETHIPDYGGSWGKVLSMSLCY